jgi:hypothetical protein
VRETAERAPVDPSRRTEQVIRALEAAVHATHDGNQKGVDVHTKADHVAKHPWLAKLTPVLQKVRRGAGRPTLASLTLCRSKHANTWETTF